MVPCSVSGSARARIKPIRCLKSSIRHYATPDRELLCILLHHLFSSMQMHSAVIIAAVKAGTAAIHLHEALDAISVVLFVYIARTLQCIL